MSVEHQQTLGIGWSAHNLGFAVYSIKVEANITRGLPGITIVGVSSSEAKSAMLRWKSALEYQGLELPRKKLIISISGATRELKSSDIDLAGIVSILDLCNRLSSEYSVHTSTLFIGRVGLDGTVYADSSALLKIRGAHTQGFTKVVCSIESAWITQNALVDTEVVYIQNINELWGGSGTEESVRVPPEIYEEPGYGSTDYNAHEPTVRSCEIDFADIQGQTFAKKACAYAAVGRHSILLHGVPGCGKSMMARALPGILPTMSQAHFKDQCALQSLISTSPSVEYLSSSVRRIAPAETRTLGKSEIQDGRGEMPFVALEHSVSAAGLLGGGAGAVKPGAVSMAHGGVLFLDEVTELAHSVVDSLRVSLDQRNVTIQRAEGHYVFPADYQLLMACNTCRCHAENSYHCVCTVAEKRRYTHFFSGALQDRIDISVQLDSRLTQGIGSSEQRGSLDGNWTGVSSSEIAQRVRESRQRSFARWENLGAGGERSNSEIDMEWVIKKIPLSSEIENALDTYTQSGEFSRRKIHTILSVMWSIADFSEHSYPTLEDFYRAINLGRHEL